MRSKYGMVTKFFSAQKYDPRQVLESLVWCAKPHRKFSRSTQSQTCGCVKHNFWDTSETPHQPDSEGESLKCPKNCFLRTHLFDFEWAEKFSVRFRTPNSAFKFLSGIIPLRRKKFRDHTVLRTHPKPPNVQT